MIQLGLTGNDLFIVWSLQGISKFGGDSKLGVATQNEETVFRH